LRGRKRAEQHLPKLLDDLKAIVEPHSQTDPTFKALQQNSWVNLGSGRAPSV